MKRMTMIVAVLSVSVLALGCGGESGDSGGDSMTSDAATDAAQGDPEEGDAGHTQGPLDDATGTEQTEPTPEDAGSDEPEPEDAGGDEPEPEDAGGDEPEPEDAGGDEPEPEDAGGDDPEPGDAGSEGDAEAGEVVSFATVFNEVLEPMGCTAGYCHAGHAGGMLMDSLESAYDVLVNMEVSTPTDCDATMRVVPGDPEASMLWIRVRPVEDDCLTADQKMPPFTDEMLTQEQLDLIHDWIATGANP